MENLFCFTSLIDNHGYNVLKFMIMFFYDGVITIISYHALQQLLTVWLVMVDLNVMPRPVFEAK